MLRKVLMKLHMYLIKSEFNFKRYFATVCHCRTKMHRKQNPHNVILRNRAG